MRGLSKYLFQRSDIWGVHVCASTGNRSENTAATHKPVTPTLLSATGADLK